MRKKKIVIPNGGMRTRSRTVKHGVKRSVRPVHLAISTGATVSNVALELTRRYPKANWHVPQVETPLFWFDSEMVKRRLLLCIPPDLFIVDGRRFRVLMQDYRRIGNRGRGYSRWLVFEERNDLPEKGRP